MADTNTTVHVAENSAEFVALKLTETIASLEKLNLYGHGDRPASRKWLLDTYAECLQAVRGNRRWE